jgi:hypothetical protein
VAVVLVTQPPTAVVAGEYECGDPAVGIGTSGAWLELGDESRPYQCDAAGEPHIEVAERETRKDLRAGSQCREASIPPNDLSLGGNELVVRIEQGVESRVVPGQDGCSVVIENSGHFSSVHCPTLEPFPRKKPAVSSKSQPCRRVVFMIEQQFVYSSDV